MKFRIFIFFVWVCSFSIVSSFHQNQEFGHLYQQHPNRPTHSNYAHNTPVLYPANSQFLKHDKPSYASNHASYSEPQYESLQQPGTFGENDPRGYENILESSAQSQAKSNYEYKPVVYIPQTHHELQRPYPDVPPTDIIHHVAKPWVLQNTYQPTLHQELYRQPIVYSEQQPSVYQNSPPLQHVQPQHTPPPHQTQPQYPRPPQHAQPQHLPPSHHQPPPQHPTPHQHPLHQQPYYKPQSSYAVPDADAQAEAYAISETNVADMIASKPEVKDYLESALLKHYLLDDLGNSHHVKSSEVKLENNDMERTTEKPHIDHQNYKHFKKQLLDNADNENKKLHFPQKTNHIQNTQTVPEETNHETIPPKNYDTETYNHPRFAYLNHKQNPNEVKTFPIEVKPVNPHHHPIAKHHPNAKHPNDILVNEQQKPAPLGNTDNSYPIEPQNSKIYETSTLEDKEITLYNHDLHVDEQRSKKQPNQKPYEDKIYPENNYIPTIIYSKTPSHSTPIDQITIENPVDKSVDTTPHGINKPKDSFDDDVSPLLLYSDKIDDTKAPLIASPDSNYANQPIKEFYSKLQSQPEVAEPATDTNNKDDVTNSIVSQKEDLLKIIVTKIDVNDKKQTINENVYDNGDKQQKGESEPRSTLPKDIAKQSSIEGSPLNADSPTDDGPSKADENLPNDDCTASCEIDPNNNGDDEEAADSENDRYAVLLSSIDLWEKILAKQPDVELQAFNVVVSSPIIEKTSRLYAFPNRTTVEESVETVWKCKGDKLPLEIRKTTTIKHPSQDENKCD